MRQSFQHDRGEDHLDIGANICDSPQIDPFADLFEQAAGDRSPLDWARRYIAKGWAPVPIPFRTKGPVLTEWGRLRLDSDTVGQHFSDKAQNIGIILGDASGGLVDIDLDCPEACKLAPAFLPATGAIFGRKGNPASHWLYRSPGLISEKVTPPGSRKALLEIRSDARQTVFPGSVHTTGEAIEWESSSPHPACVPPEELEECFRHLAAATMLARTFPNEGEGRHDATLALIGFLTRAGWGQDRVIEFGKAVRATINADSKKPLRTMAADAAKRLAHDETLYGLPMLRQAFGENVAERVCELIGYEVAPQIDAQAIFDEEPLPNDPGETATSDDGLRLIDPATWQDIDVPERAWALQGWIPQGQATYLTGPGSAGKSLLSQQLATCIALGLPFLGMSTKQARALYLTCEDDSDELHRRQKAICASLGVSVADLSANLFLASLVGDANTELCTFTDKGELRKSDRYSTIRKAAKSNGITFLALDNTAHLFSGNENARHEVASFVSLLNRLAMDIGGAVLFLGHPNKAGDSFSGSTAWENQVRSRLFMQTPTESDGSIVDRDVRVLSRQKSNYARNGEQIGFRWHEWAFVSEDDLPLTFSPAARAQIEDDLFIECLRKSASERRTVSPSASAANYAPRVFAKMACAGSIGIKGFESALHRLLDCEAIRNDQRIYQRDNRTWATGLGVAGGCTNPHTPSPGNGGIPAQSLHKADAQTRTDPAQSPHKPACTGPLYTTYISGEALGGTPPDYPHAFDGGTGQ